MGRSARFQITAQNDSWNFGLSVGSVAMGLGSALLVGAGSDSLVGSGSGTRLLVVSIAVWRIRVSRSSIMAAAGSVARSTPRSTRICRNKLRESIERKILGHLGFLRQRWRSEHFRRRRLEVWHRIDAIENVHQRIRVGREVALLEDDLPLRITDQPILAIIGRQVDGAADGELGQALRGERQEFRARFLDVIRE